MVLKGLFSSHLWAILYEPYESPKNINLVGLAKL